MSAEWRANRARIQQDIWDSNPGMKIAAAERMKGNDYKKGKGNSDLQKQVTFDRMKGNTYTLGWKMPEEQKAAKRALWADPVGGQQRWNVATHQDTTKTALKRAG